VLIFGAAPELAKPLNLQPLQVESILLAFLILIAHGLTWEFMNSTGRIVRARALSYAIGTNSVVVALDLARPRSRANLIEPGVLYFSR